MNHRRAGKTNIFPARFFCLALATVLTTGKSIAEPFEPLRDDQVLERLYNEKTPPALLRPIQELRKALALHPQDLDLTIRLARSYMALGRVEGDPRYFGYAQALLNPWQTDPQPPVPILILRATVRQYNHDFDGALVDLASALRRDPANMQASLTQAMIYQTQGEYAKARKSCFGLLHDTGLLLACSASVISFNGQAADSSRLLETALQRGTYKEPEQAAWVFGILADTARRRGQAENAERYFARSLALSPHTILSMVAYADFLLDQGQNEKVVAYLKDETRVDALLLRLCLAEQRLKKPSLPEHIALLQSRFDAARIRGDIRHRREEAWFNLELVHQPRHGLFLAQQNWKVQREPEDARIFLECALASNDKAAAQPVLQWLKETKLEDVRLSGLVKQFQPSTPAP